MHNHLQFLFDRPLLVPTWKFDLIIRILTGRQTDINKHPAHLQKKMVHDILFENDKDFLTTTKNISHIAKG